MGRVVYLIQGVRVAKDTILIESIEFVSHPSYVPFISPPNPTSSFSSVVFFEDPEVLVFLHLHATDTTDSQSTC